jgi:hypothetical protein
MRLLAHGPLARILFVFAYAMIVSGCGGVDVTQSAVSPASSSTPISTSTSSSAAGLIALSSGSYNVSAAGTAVLTIYRTGSSAGVTTVGYSTVDGTATAGADYVATEGSVTWQDGDVTAKTVAVAVNSQASGKSFGFELTSVEGTANFGSPAAATIYVLNAAAATASVTLSWTAPTDNTNGTALTNLAGFDIYYGTAANALTQKISIGSVGVLNYVISDLTAGTWYFEVIAVNSAGTQSGPSSTVSATI